eukprot:12922608-Prorocentrum_lima.AAC.1
MPVSTPTEAEKVRPKTHFPVFEDFLVTDAKLALADTGTVKGMVGSRPFLRYDREVLETLDLGVVEREIGGACGGIG